MRAEIVLFLTFSVCCGAAQPNPLLHAGIDNSTEFASALFMLAGEKYAANKDHGEKWIFTTHDSLQKDKVIKYSDGDFIVVSIPNILPNYEGYCKFIQSYNTFDLHEADTRVAQGNYNEARKWYKLLLHFDVCSSLRDKLILRMSLLDQIEKNEDAETAKEEMKKLAAEVPALMVTGIDSEPAKKVTNLLDLPVEKVKRQ
jgi:hypothetical protein